MADLVYMQGRKEYGRPQAMMWANNSGTVVVDDPGPQPNPSPTDGQSFYIPLGYEIGSLNHNGELYTGDEFLILTDDNRSEIKFTPTRIETRKRTVNGRMRSYHVADKLKISTSWDMVPSRSFSTTSDFDSSGSSPHTNTNSSYSQFTTDGGAGGVEILDWYKNYTGSFWVYLSYDKYSNFGKDPIAYENLPKYNQVIEMFFSSFDYSVVKRGGTGYDYWNISVELEEV